MEFVVDTNILLAGLLKPSATQKIILSEEILLFAPEFSLREIEKHSEEFAERMGKNQREFEIALFTIVSKIKIIPKEEYEPFRQEALKLCPEGHKDDWPFLALALKLACAMWSQDFALKKQLIIKVYSTTELLERFFPGACEKQ